MGCPRAIYNDIASSTSDFFRPRIKNALVQGRALGPSALVHGPALGHFLTSEEKKPRFRGYIVVYSPPTPHIYITYIFIYFFFFEGKYDINRGAENVPVLVEYVKKIFVMYIRGVGGLYTTI